MCAETSLTEWSRWYTLEYSINYLSIAVIKTACSRQLIERRNYLELMVTERWVHYHHGGKCGSKQARWPESSHLKPPAGSRECELEWHVAFEISKQAHSDRLHLARSHLRNLSKQHYQLGTSYSNAQYNGETCSFKLSQTGFSQSSEGSSLLYYTSSLCECEMGHN